MFSIFKKKPTPDVAAKLEVFIRLHGTPFGSQIWGGAHKKSDYDYIMPVREFNDLQLMLQQHNVSVKKTHEYRSALSAEAEIVFTINKKKYQILVFEKQDHITFRGAIRYMTDYITTPMTNKRDRCNTFTMFYDFLQFHELPKDHDILQYLSHKCPELLI